MTSVLLKRISLLALAACLVAPAVLAQNQQQPPEEGSAVEVSDDELDTVAKLYVDIEEVQEEYQARLSQAGSSEEAQAIQQEMTEAIDQTIVEYEGLTPERYDEIIQTAQVNNELREKLLDRIEEEQERRNG